MYENKINASCLHLILMFLNVNMHFNTILFINVLQLIIMSVITTHILPICKASLSIHEIVFLCCMAGFLLKEIVFSGQFFLR